MRCLVMCLILVMSASLSFADEKKDITLEWLYKKDEFNIKPVGVHLPRSLQWSPEGHQLAWLVSRVTEAPHFAIYDPAKDATPYLFSPFAIHDAIVALASMPSGVSIESTASRAAVPDDATAIKTIDWYQWREDKGDIRFHIDGKRYLWTPDDNLLSLEERPDLPEGEKNDIHDSDDERFAAYTRSNDLYVYDFVNRSEIRLTHDGSESVLNGRHSWVYWEEFHYRRSWRAFEWAPDNSAIAYLQYDESDVSRYPVTDFSKTVPETRNMAYPKAGTKNPTVRLGVVSLSSRDTRWIDLGEPYEYICGMKWTPDGELAIQVMNRDQRMLRLLFADPATGRSRVVLEESDEQWVFNHPGPFFFESREGFVWISERSGYRHFYLYDGDGELVRQLTEGPWDANPSKWGYSLSMDEEGRRLYFTAGVESPVERHGYSVSLNGGALRRLTEEPGMHSLDWSSDYRFAVNDYSSFDKPRVLQIIDRDGGVVRTMGEITPDDYEPYHIHGPELVSFENEDGLEFFARVLKPRDFDPNQRYPVIVYVYGGPAGQVVQHRFASPQDMAFVNRGFILVGFDTRGTEGRGREWIEAIYQNAADKPLDDLELLVEELKTWPYVDGDSIGVWGWSNGGYITCAAMTKRPGLFRAGAAVAPVTDFRLYDTIYTERYMGLPDDNKDGYEASDTTAFADQLEGALLLAHGVSDDNVHIQNIYKMVDALIEAEKDYELYVYPQRGHGIGGDERRYHLFSRILEFFETHLGAK